MYREKSKTELQSILTGLQKEYAEWKGKGLKLDMSRGKPCAQQLDASMDMLDVLDSSAELIAEDGADCRNYGGLGGIPEAKRLMAAMLEMDEAEVFVGAGSSLNLMHDLMTFCWLFPLPGCALPWGRQEKVKFLCPSPGYDRHFAVSAHLGAENIAVPMTADGPDMDVVEKMIAADPSIKGMWCVPKYSNPTGVTFSDETVKRLAAMKAPADFRIFWDNAYSVHHLNSGDRDSLSPLMAELKKSGNENRAFQFCSFAKVTFGGGGIAAVGASRQDMAFIMEHMSMQVICADKVNQLRHVRYLRDMDGLEAHMQKHADILRPKFQAVQEVLHRELDGLGIAEWSDPKGGYFISFNTPEGCARRTVALCKEAGVVLTPAGATYPDGDDPADRNIRIAPSFPTADELRQAAALLCLCTRIASVEKLLA